MRFFTRTSLLLVLLFGPAAAGLLDTVRPKIVLAQVELDDQANLLLEQGIEFYKINKWKEALAKWQQALELYIQTDNHVRQAITLNNIGEAYRLLGSYPEALQSYEQSLALMQEMEDFSGEATILSNIAIVHSVLGNYSEALNYYDKSLIFWQELRDHTSVANTINNIGIIYKNLGDYPKALQYYKTSLTLSLELDDYSGVADSLGNIGVVYRSLGNYLEALNHFEASLNLLRDLEDYAGEADITNNIGIVYRDLEDYAKALQYFESSLAIHYELGNNAGVATVLGNVGIIYNDTGKYKKALQYFEDRLAVKRSIGDRLGEAFTLEEIGIVYKNLEDYSTALQSFERSLILLREIEYRAGKASILKNIGSLFEKQTEYELAIIFFKQAINIHEQFRERHRSLDQTEQETFTAKVEDVYRNLADLLLRQNRIIEAQRVLDLLKVQELDDYFRGVRSSSSTQDGVAYWQVEETLLKLYKELLLAGDELKLLQSFNFNELTPEQETRLAYLTPRKQELLENFQQWIDHPEVSEALTTLRTSTEGRNLEIEDYATLQANLAKLPKNTVLLYPLILGKRLELVLLSPYAPPIRHPVDVPAEQLNHVITHFGQSLKYARPDIKIHAQKLYEWLIQPLEENLKDTEADMIIFAPDGPLRYVPLAALHDGTNWLAERFSFTHITAAALTNFDAKPKDNPRLLAAACSKCNFQYQVAGQDFRFSLLPYTDREVSLLTQQIPNTTVLRNLDFTPDALQLRLGSYEILHLATHGAFVTGQPEESFIVFGDQSHLNLTEIERKWKGNMPNADLVVLSACETAVGSAQLGSGVEILGLGFQIQHAGAKAALASLWQVSDGGTQVLMNAFYAALASGKTKAEALQLAQQALLTGDGTDVGLPRGGLVPADLPDEVAAGMSHPHYWAPFILIGNGL